MNALLMNDYVTTFINIFLQASALGLNDHHQATVVNYMRFARYQQGQRLRAVDACFEDLKDSR